MVKQLRAEIIAIERTFPELALPQKRTALARSVARVKRRTKTMSAAARKAVSLRMKRYWAERRKAKARVKYPSSEHCECLNGSTALHARPQVEAGQSDTRRPRLDIDTTHLR